MARTHARSPMLRLRRLCQIVRRDARVGVDRSHASVDRRRIQTEDGERLVPYRASVRFPCDRFPRDVVSCPSDQWPRVPVPPSAPMVDHERIGPQRDELPWPPGNHHADQKSRTERNDHRPTPPQHDRHGRHDEKRRHQNDEQCESRLPPPRPVRIHRRPAEDPPAAIERESALRAAMLDRQPAHLVCTVRAVLQQLGLVDRVHLQSVTRPRPANRSKVVVPGRFCLHSRRAARGLLGNASSP